MRNLRSIGLYVGAGMGLGFVGLAMAVLMGPTPLGIDLAITRALQRVIPEAGPVATVLLQGHSALTLLPLLLGFLLAVLALRQWMAVLLVPLGLPAFLLAGLVKEATQRHRPSADLVEIFSDPGGWSFPSHTATSATILLGLLVYFLWRALGSASAWPRRGGRAVLLAGAAAIFLWQNGSIVYAGRHWFTDVMGGWLLGGAWLVLLLGVWHWWRGRRSRRLPLVEPVKGASDDY